MCGNTTLECGWLVSKITLVKTGTTCLNCASRCQEGFVQPAHLGPKTHPGHAEVALQALLQVVVQALILGIG